VTFQVVAIVESFADHPSHKPEELQVVRVDVGVSVGMERGAVAAESKERIIRVEHLLGQLDEKVSDQTPSVDSCFSLEGDLEGLLEVAGIHVVDLVKGVHKDSLPINLNAFLTVPSTAVSLSELLSEVGSLVVKVKKVGHIRDYLIQFQVKAITLLLLFNCSSSPALVRHVDFKELIEHLLVVQAENAEGLQPLRKLIGSDGVE